MKIQEKLSLLWIFVTLNYLYCDVLSFFEPGIIKEVMTGKLGNIEFTQGFLLGSAILMEIPIAMVLLSRLLKYRKNRWLNIVAGTIMTIVQISSLFIGKPALHYVFFSIIEIITTVFIIQLAWKWKSDTEYI